MLKTVGVTILLFISVVFCVVAYTLATMPESIFAPIITGKETATTTNSAKPISPMSPISPIESVSTTTIKLKTPVKPTTAKKITATTPTTSPKQTPVVETPSTGSGQATPVQTTPQIPFETINVLTRKTVVNILCSADAGSSLSPVTGSGVVIRNDGVILTNAHLGQFFLLKDFNGQKNSVQCVIRAGNPAYPAYTAELVYISPAWIAENKTILTEQNPKGTGEHDYAFLRITGKIDGSPMTEKIPFLPISLSENNATGNYVLLASYPAGFLGGQSILQDLFQSSAITKIGDVYTFGSSTIDLISVPATIVSQKGSSGGAVVDGQGELIGIITTETEAEQTGDRDLRAITLSYINRDLKAESGSDLADILSSPAEYAKSFNQNIAPKLTEILTNAILKK